MTTYEGDWKNLGTIEVFEVPANVGLLTDVAFWKDLFLDLHQTQTKYATGLSDIVNRLTTKYEEERPGGTEMKLFHQMVKELRECIQQNASVVMAESDISRNKLDRLTEFKSTSEKKLKTLQHQCNEAGIEYHNLKKKMEKVTEKFEDQLSKLESVARDVTVTDKNLSKMKARIDVLVKKYQQDANVEDKLRQDLEVKCRELQAAWTDVAKPKATTVIKSIISRKSARHYRLNIDKLFQEIGICSSKSTDIPVFKETLLDKYEELIKRKSPVNFHDAKCYNGSGDHDTRITPEQLSSTISQKEIDLNVSFPSNANEPDATTETKDVTKMRHVDVVALSDYCTTDKTHLRLRKGTRFVQLQPADPAFLCYGEVQSPGRRSRRGLYPSNLVELALD